MKCINCGCEVPDGAKFCAQCGFQFVQNNNQGQSQQTGNLNQGMYQQTGDYNKNQGNSQATSGNQGGYWKDGQYIKGASYGQGANSDKPKKKGCLTAIIICIAIFIGLSILAVGCSIIFGDSDSSSSDKSTADSKTEKTTELITEAKEDETEEITLEEKEAEVKEPEEEVTESKKEEFDPSEYRTDLDYESLCRKPDDFIGKKITMSGTVNSLLELDGKTMLQVNVGEELAFDMAIVYYDPKIMDIRVLENDHVTFYGVFNGLDKYETVLGATKNDPSFDADYINVDSYVSEAAAPTGELRTGQFTDIFEEDGIAVTRVAEVSYQDGEAYGISLFADEMDIATNMHNRGGEISCFLVDEGNGKYKGDIPGEGTITIMAYEDYFTVTCDPLEGHEYSFTRLSGSFYYSGEHESDGTNKTYTDADFIFPYSDVKELTEADLKGMSKDELALGRNEIFARHGYIFKDPTFSDYFSTKPWYKPRYTADTFDDSVFNDFERKNIEFIKSFE